MGQVNTSIHSIFANLMQVNTQGADPHPARRRGKAVGLSLLTYGALAEFGTVGQLPNIQLQNSKGANYI
jgi:hypothetical protein